MDFPPTRSKKSYENYMIDEMRLQIKLYDLLKLLNQYVGQVFFMGQSYDYYYCYDCNNRGRSETGGISRKGDKSK